jgi:hypothetical protein
MVSASRVPKEAEDLEHGNSLQFSAGGSQSQDCERRLVLSHVIEDCDPGAHNSHSRRG